MNETTSGQSGRLIVLEGPDGVGKTSVAHRLLTVLLTEAAKSGRPWPKLVTASDGATEWARKLNGAIHDRDGMISGFDGGPPDALAFQLAAAAAARDGYERRIRPWLDEGRDVICDRIHAVSSVVYGTAALAPEAETRTFLNTLMNVIAATDPPEATWFILDAPWSVIKTRKDFGGDVWEARGKDFMAFVAGMYLSLDEDGGDLVEAVRESTGWRDPIRVDADQEINRVAENILSHLKIEVGDAR